MIQDRPEIIKRASVPTYAAIWHANAPFNKKYVCSESRKNTFHPIIHNRAPVPIMLAVE